MDMVSKDEVMQIIDNVMNNREIDSIRNAILAIRDGVKEIEPIDADHVCTRCHESHGAFRQSCPFHWPCEQ